MGIRLAALLLILGVAVPAQAQNKSTKPTPPKKWTIKLLKAKFTKPWWADKPAADPNLPRKQIGAQFAVRNALDDDGLMESVRLLHHAIEKNIDDGYGPRCMYWLAQAYEFREFYPEAYHWFKQVAILKTGTNMQTHKNFPRNLKDLKDAGMIGVARICAKTRQRRYASNYLRQLKTKTAYLLSLTGEVYNLIGLYKQADSAFKVACSTSKYPNGGFGVTHPFFIRLNAVRSAFSHGNYSEAKRLGQPVIRRARDSYRWPQEKGVHDNIMSVFNLIDSKRKVNLRYVRDGKWKATVGGWGSPITMEVTVKKRKITKVVVVSHDEKRAFNAFTVVPEQILARQKTQVDNVSGATSTAFGIMAACEKALTSDEALGRKRRR